MAAALSSQGSSIALNPSAKVDGSDTSYNVLTARKTPLGWDYPQDPGNPKNWSIVQRIGHTALPSLFGFAVAFGSSVYVPGIPQLAERMGVSVEVATLGISVYSLGLGLGPVLGAPISEANGRKAVYLLTIPVFLLFVVGAGLSQNITSFLICRFLAAAAGSPSLAIGGGTVADLWDMSEGGAMAAILVVQTFFLGPSLGPLIGGYTLETLGTWQWLMWVMLIVTGPLYVAIFFTSETSHKEILRRRASERGLPQPPRLPPAVALKMLFNITLLRPVKMLFAEPIVAFMALYTSYAFGVLFAMFTAYPYIFMGVYKFTTGESGLAFLGIFIGTLLAVLTFYIFDKTLYQKAKRRAPPDKSPAPEERLYTSMVGSFGIPISLFCIGWTSRRDIHWAVPVIAGIPFGWGMSSLFFSGMAYLVDTYDALFAASAIAANCLLRYAFGAAFPLFTIQMYDRLGIAWATSLLGFLSLIMLPIPWVLYAFGPALRAKSIYV